MWLVIIMILYFLGISLLIFFFDVKRGVKDGYIFKVVYFDNIYLMIYLFFYEGLWYYIFIKKYL